MRRRLTMTRNSNSENWAITMKVLLLGFIALMAVLSIHLGSLWRSNALVFIKEDVELLQNLSLPRGAAANILPLWRRYRSHRQSLLRHIVKYPDAFEIPSTIPKMIVFDLDATLWWPETYRLPGSPTLALLGSLGDGLGEGVMGMQVPPNGPTVTLFPWAREVLQFAFLQSKFENMKFAAVSTSAFPSYVHLCLAIELFPGVTLGSIFDYKLIGDVNGLHGPWLTSHFLRLRELSGIGFNEMVFYDDGLWRDQVGRMQSILGVLGQTTPSGLSMQTFILGLERFEQQANA